LLASFTFVFLVAMVSSKYYLLLLANLVFIPGGAFAQGEFRVTHFGRCFSEDAIMQKDGSWWFFEQGRGIVDPIKYGGSYVTTRRTISASQYGSKISGNFDATGISLKMRDGSWVDTFYLQISDHDVICGQP